MEIIKTYYLLTKPGIIMGNLIAAIGAFALGARGNLNFTSFISLLFGTSLIIASACVFNNYLDRDIDAKMRRTRKRALVTGAVPLINAVIYATILGIAGLLILILYTNNLTAVVGVTGFLVYVLVYTFSKRKSEHGTLIGSISGAIPPVAGYTAATNQFDTAALLLFLILVFWQMPHFYAIALYRMKEYQEAGIPVLPLKKGIPATKRQMLFYVSFFIITSALLSVLGYAGVTYLLVTLVLGFLWFKKSIAGIDTKDTEKWAREMFKLSIVILMSLCILWALDVVLP